MCDTYLLTHHKNDLIKVLECPDENKHFSININFLELFENDQTLGSLFLDEPETTLQEWDTSLLKVQTRLILEDNDVENLVLKNNIHCRIYGLPACPELHRSLFPRNEDAGKFLQISGTVIRITAAKMLEYRRSYICAKCKYQVTVKADYERRYIIQPPKRCSNPEGCEATNLINLTELDSDNCKDYQEIKMQEQVSKLGVGSMPNSMWVTLEDDLVDICKPGDNITVCGIVKRRWNTFSLGKKIQIELVVKANHVHVTNPNSSSNLITPEMKQMFTVYWENYADQPIVGRDLILKSFSPQLFGLYTVKLAIAVILAGGVHVDQDKSTGVTVRSEPHLLLVGDPGTGKSHLLRFASKVIPRSVLTTGVGSTAAGLTVTAFMENGEWQLEAGALVLADGGICCIDEFNSMKEHDRTCIHEAMEQQTISVAKASIVCKLKTRCSILAATNPKGNLDPSQPLSLNIALASPLLSRFDLILLLRDTVRDDWDNLVADYILDGKYSYSKLTDNILWNLEMLQAYFATIRKINPLLSPEAHTILMTYYQVQRRITHRNKARTTVRLLDSLVRLSQGHARLMFHHRVEVMDAVYAVLLVEAGLEGEAAALDIPSDEHGTFPENPMEHYKDIMQIILTKLNLTELSEREMSTLTSAGSKGTSSKKKVESRFFANKKINTEDPTSNVDDSTSVNTNLSSEKSEINESPSLGAGRNDSEEIQNAATTASTNENPVIKACTENSTEGKGKKRTKKPKALPAKKICVSDDPVQNDLQMLNLIPSVNDDFGAVDLNIDFDDIEETPQNEKASSPSLTENKSSNNVHVEHSGSNVDDKQVENNNQKPDLPKFLDPKLSQSSKFRLFREQFQFRPKNVGLSRENSADSGSNMQVNRTNSEQSIKSNPSTDDTRIDRTDSEQSITSNLSSVNNRISRANSEQSSVSNPSTRNKQMTRTYSEQSSTSNPSTIFQNQPSEIDDLDLDI